MTEANAAPGEPEIVRPAPAPGSLGTRLRALAGSRELRNTLLYVLSSAFGAVLGIVTLPLFSRYLSVTDFGTVGYVSSINSFLAPLFVLSLNSYYINQYYVNPDESRRTDLLSTLIIFTTGWSLFCIGLFSVLGYAAFAYFGVSVPFFPYMLVLLISNVAQGVFTYATLQYRLVHRAWGYALLTIAQAALMTGLGLVLVRSFHAGALGRLNGMLYGNLVVGFVALVVLWPRLRARFDSGLLRAALRFSLPLIPVTVVALLFDTIDRLFIERMASLRELGFYNVAMQYGSAITILSSSIYRAYEPGYFEMAARGDFARINRSFRFVTLLFFAGCFGLIVGSGPVINLLTHGRFGPSVPLANLLIVSFFLKAVYLLCTVLLTIVGRTRVMMWTSLLGLGLFMVANYTLLAGFGIAGAAYAKVLPMVVLIALSVYLSGHLRVFRSLLWLTLGLLLVLSAAAIWLEPLLRPFFSFVLTARS